MKYRISKSVGLNTDTQAAQVIYNFCDDQNVFIGVLKITGDNAFITGRQLLSELSDNYCEQEGSAGEKLTQAFEKAKEQLKDVEFDLLLGAVSAKVLYLFAKGQVTVFLRREQKTVTLLPEGNEQLISGFLKEGDKVFLSTQALTTLLGEDLSQNLNLTLDDWEDELNGLLSSQEENDGLAGALLELETPEEEAAETSKTKSLEDEGDDILPLGGTDKDLDLQGQLERTPKKTARLFFSILSQIKNIFRIFPKNGKARLVIALVLLLVITSIVGYQFWISRAQNNQKESQQLTTQAKSIYDQAQTLVLLNPTEAQNKFKQATELLNQALSKNPKNAEAQSLKDQIAQGSSPEKTQATSAEFLNLDSTKKDFKGTKLSLLGKSLLILDSTKNTLIQASLDKKEPKVLAEEDKIGDAQDINLTDQAIFIFSEDKGILRYDLGNDKVSTVVKADKSWGKIQSIGSFGTNIYLLDSVENQIWKYLPTTSGYSDKRNYLTGDAKISGGNDMQIDSSIYVLSDGSKIEKFTKGASADFSISGLDKPLNAAKALFTNEDTDNLYVLDSGNSRLVVLSKTGTFVAQYQSDKFNIASDLVVDEKAKKVYLLDGSKIYQSDIK